MKDVLVKKKHILVVSGEPLVLAEIKMTLMNHFDVSIAATSAAALTIVEACPIAAVVLHIDENREQTFSTLSDMSESLKKHIIPAVLLPLPPNSVGEPFQFVRIEIDVGDRAKQSLHDQVD